MQIPSAARKHYKTIFKRLFYTEQIYRRFASLARRFFILLEKHFSLSELRLAFAIFRPFIAWKVFRFVGRFVVCSETFGT